jgi:hypothetical protein
MSADSHPNASEIYFKLRRFKHQSSRKGQGNIMNMNVNLHQNRYTGSHLKKRVVTRNIPAPKKDSKGVRALAEAIILQSIEDLCCEGQKSKQLNFFTGEGFNICSKIAGMNFYDQVSVLNLVKKASVKFRGVKQRSRQQRFKGHNFSSEKVTV